MARKRALERQLADLEPFADPRAALEQYPTPAELAATVLHLADLQGDLDRPVIDLGSGTGVLAIGAALRGPPRVVGIERDRRAIETARGNERSLRPLVAIDWLWADATRPPLSLPAATVVMNPPFGAQRGHRHADRAFLAAAAGLATVSYSVHNAGSRDFIEAFAADRGGTVTHAVEAVLTLDRQFPFHDDDRRDQPVEVYRVAWG